MGEYWKPVNMTRKEFIHPHHVNCGLKLPEWNYASSPVRQVMNKQWTSSDDVRAISDYGSELQLSGRGDEPSPEYHNIEEHFVEIGLDTTGVE